MRGMIRDIMRYRAQFFDKPEQQLKQARGLLTFLSESVKSENNAYGILLHGSPPLDDFQRQLLVLLNGTRSRTDLLEALTQKVHAGELLLHQDGQRVSAVSNARELLDSWLTPALESPARYALLIEV